MFPNKSTDDLMFDMMRLIDRLKRRKGRIILEIKERKRNSCFVDFKLDSFYLYLSAKIIDKKNDEKI